VNDLENLNRFITCGIIFRARISDTGKVEEYIKNNLRGDIIFLKRSMKVLKLEEVDSLYGDKPNKKGEDIYELQGSGTKNNSL